MSLGYNIRQGRKALGLSQAKLAEALGVSFQAVSSWERDLYQPDLEMLGRLAAALHTSIACLLGEEACAESFDVKDGLFSSERMYTFVKSAATALGLTQTLRALPFARDMHQGQFRKGSGMVPNISHPLTMCCHALAMGISSDQVLSAILLHDILEDCDAKPQDLPVSYEVREIVQRLSRDWDLDDQPGYDQQYYAGIAQSPEAMLIKLIDRCHNLSVGASAMSYPHLQQYATHAMTYVLPLADKLKQVEPAYSNACFLLKYQMLSLVYTINSLQVE